MLKIPDALQSGSKKFDLLFLFSFLFDRSSAVFFKQYSKPALTIDYAYAIIYLEYNIMYAYKLIKHRGETIEKDKIFADIITVTHACGNVYCLMR